VNQEPIYLLPPAERAKKYRELADELERLIGAEDNSRPADVQAAYSELAHHWRALAAHAERAAAFPSPTLDDADLGDADRIVALKRSSAD